jgi:hypothetical protein
MNSNGISFGSVHPRQRRKPYRSIEHRRHRGVGTEEKCIEVELSATTLLYPANKERWNNIFIC